MEFLQIRQGRIVTASGRPFFLRGVNLGGWLMMEGYFMQSPNRAAQIFKKDFEDRLGKAALAELEEKFRETFIGESDFENAAKMGCNCVRLPFNYRLIENIGS